MCWDCLGLVECSQGSPEVIRPTSQVVWKFFGVFDFEKL